MVGLEVAEFMPKYLDRRLGERSAQEGRFEPSLGVESRPFDSLW